MSSQTTEKGTPVFQPRVSINSILCNVAAIDYDNIACSYTATTDVYVLKKSTSTVKTITVTYSDATKQEVSTIAMA